MSHSQIIVTSNLRDFPADVLREFNVEPQPPDLFLLHQANLDPRAAAAVLRRQAGDKSKPPRRVKDVLARLDVNAPTFVHAMRLLVGPKMEGELTLPAAFSTLEADFVAVRARQRKHLDSGQSRHCFVSADMGAAYHLGGCQAGWGASS